jgi:hypothetical protein
MTDMHREAKLAAEALAHLYVWASVVDILEGGSTPSRQDAKASKEVNRVIKIAKSECNRMVTIHDKHIAALRYRDEQRCECAYTCKFCRDEQEKDNGDV